MPSRLVRSVPHTVSAADTDEKVFEVPPNRIGYLVEIEVYNPSTTDDAVVTVKDKFTPDYPEGSSEQEREKANIKVLAGTTEVLTDIKDKMVLGTVYVRSSVAGVKVILGVELR